MNALTPAARRRSTFALVLALSLLAACKGADLPEGPQRQGLGEPPQSSPGGAGQGADPISGADLDARTLDARLRAAAPPRDPLDLALRMGRIEAAPDFATPDAPPALELGTIQTFWLHDINAQAYFEIEARLEAVRDSAYFWVQTDQPFDPEALARGADGFDAKVYPAVREAFGSEWSPGIDGDPRVHVLHHQPVSGIAGYFYSVDEQPRAVEPYSNQREMFYINLSVYTPGSFDYLALLAHELQHMIHWNHDANEAVWANEGLSELSAEIAGYRAQNGSSFFGRPDTPLLEWEADAGANTANYAASYAFMAWLRARFGEPVIRAFVEAEADGAAGVEAALEAIGQPSSFDAIFLDWAAANAMPPDIRRGRPSFDYGSSEVSRAEWSDWPAEGLGETVSQYGTDYYALTGAVEDGRIRLDFEGQSTVGLLDASPEAAADPAAAPPLVWWSQRGDNIASRLTLPLDLSGSQRAALRLELWQAIEEHWDYAYYRVSTDGGRSWQALGSARTSEENPSGNNLGAGLTGFSNGWVEERLDLSAFAGQEILLRWELVTDDAVNLEGLALRKLVLETDAGDRAIDLMAPEWQAEGWQRVPLTLPQRWGLQLLIFGPSGLEIWRPEVDAEGRARIEAEDIPGDATVILAVSGLTPATRQTAGYQLMPVAAP